jgi:hypothetical protein
VNSKLPRTRFRSLTSPGAKEHVDEKEDVFYVDRTCLRLTQLRRRERIGYATP